MWQELLGKLESETWTPGQGRDDVSSFAANIPTIASDSSQQSLEFLLKVRKACWARCLKRAWHGSPLMRARTPWKHADFALEEERSSADDQCSGSATGATLWPRPPAHRNTVRS